MKFVIKSKNRVEKIKKKTLTLLRSYGVKDEDIFLFVSNEEDHKNYSDNFKDCNIILGDDGIIGIDNYIVNYFKEGEQYIYMNDDVSAIYKLNEYQELQKLSSEQFWEMITIMFGELYYYGGSFACLFPCSNAVFMARASPINYHLCVCMDPFSAVINNKDIKLTEFIVKKEDGSYFTADVSDSEKAIQHFNSRGGIVRLNHYCIDVEYHSKEGGYQGRTEMTERLSAEALFKMYPKEISNVRYKKNKTTSIIFKRLKSKWII